MENNFTEEKCENNMLQCIKNYSNISENDDDFIYFEKQFNNWDYDLIILDKIRNVSDMENKEDNYIVLDTL